MAKMRVNELAKKIGISNKELITLLNDNGIASVTSHANNISEDAASAAIKLYNSSKTEKTEQRSKPTDAADNNKVNTIPDIKNASEAPKAREAKEEARVVNTTVVHDGGAKRGEADSSSKSGRDNSGQPPKKKIVMKINPQNISSKGNAKKLARKDGKPEQGRRNDGRQENKRVLSENDRRRQEILERQRKIEEFKRQQEAEELRLQQEIEMKRQQIREAKNEAGSGLEGRTLESLQPESTAYAGRGRSGGEAASVAAKAPQTGSQQIRATASDNEAVKNSGNDASANTEKTNKSQAIIGANSTQVMESKKDKHQTGKPSKTQGRDSYGRTNEARGADSRQGASREGRGNSSGNNGNSSDRQGNRRDFRAGERTGGSGGFAAKRPFQREGGREASSENTDRKNYQDKDRRQFKPRDNQGFRSNSMPRFDKDKDEQDSKNVRREKPRNDKSHSGAATAAIDDRNKKAKDKIRESKESKSKDKRKDKNERFEKSFSLERTSKKTHKQALKSKQAMIASEQSKEQEKVSMITIPESLSIKELAEKMKIGSAILIKELFLKGKVVTLNQEIDYATAEEIAMEHEILCELEEKVDVIEELLKEDEESEDTMVKRPPVVCVMGHVDHGKTSLLDAIRNTRVIDKEAGGITQHIGAYMVKVNDQKITFLDTPGHEAFTAMRMRGANSTDIAILVVAADDGVMPQTVEAINHAKAAGVEIIVAINKIDKPSANVDRVKQELSDHGLIPEDWGGSHVFVQVSAKAGTGIDELLEMILLTADVAELKANPNRRARGLVLEAKLDKGRGSVANILVQKGTLRVGDFISAGHCSGKVRAMMDDKGRKIKEATASTPVEILGLNDVPNAGEILVAHDTDKDAKSFAATFVSEGRERLLEDTKSKMSLDDLFAKIKEDNLKEFSIVVKADVQGSAEALKQSLEKLSNDEVVIKIIHSGVGAINESDVILASASNAIIIGFNVRPDAQAKSVAESEGVDLRLYGVIYQAIEDVEAAMRGMLDPIYEEQVIGHAEIRQIFKASGIGNIAGSYILDGRFERDCKVRISRGEEMIFEGKLASLKRFKDDVKEVKTGFECGLVFDGFNDIEELDRVEAYKIVEVKR